MIVVLSDSTATIVPAKQPGRSYSWSVNWIVVMLTVMAFLLFVIFGTLISLHIQLSALSLAPTPANFPTIGECALFPGQHPVQFANNNRAFDVGVHEPAIIRNDIDLARSTIDVATIPPTCPERSAVFSTAIYNAANLSHCYLASTLRFAVDQSITIVQQSNAFALRVTEVVREFDEGYEISERIKEVTRQWFEVAKEHTRQWVLRWF